MECKRFSAVHFGKKYLIAISPTYWDLICNLIAITLLKKKNKVKTPQLPCLADVTRCSIH